MGRPRKTQQRDLRDYCVAIRRPNGRHAILTKLSTYERSPKDPWLGDVDEAYVKAKLQSYINRHEEGEFGTAPYEGGMAFLEEWSPI